MSFLDVNKEPTRVELRIFGALFALFCGLVGGLLWWKAEAVLAARIVWGVGVAGMLLYYAVPPLQRMAFRAWIRVTFPIGWTVSHVILGLIYYAVFTPIGVLMRLFGRDVLNRKLDRSAATYWSAHRPANSSSRYFKQF